MLVHSSVAFTLAHIAMLLWLAKGCYEATGLGAAGRAGGKSGCQQEEYITICRLEGKSLKTIWGYHEKLLRFARAVGGTLANFNLPTVRNYIASVQKARKYEGHPYQLVSDEPVSMMTVRNHVRILTAFAAWLEREEYTRSNVLAKLRAPKAPRKVMQTLTPEKSPQCWRVSLPTRRLAVRM